jgi:hypothetical protein
MGSKTSDKEKRAEKVSSTKNMKFTIVERVFHVFNLHNKLRAETSANLLFINKTKIRPLKWGEFAITYEINLKFESFILTFLSLLVY